MAIIDDYPQIAAELRRIRAEHRSEGQPAPPLDPARQTAAAPAGHPMRRTLAGELLYRRLIASRR